MNIVLFETAGKQKYNAGSKARRDALQIAINCGYKHITLFHNENTKPIVVLEIAKGCVTLITKAKKNNRILIQYPYSPMILNKMLFWILRTGGKIKGYEISVLIHDLNGLRLNDKALLQKELKMMRGCNIIYHNESMKKACEKILKASSYQILGIFDYLYSDNICFREYSKCPTIMIAGCLEKDKCGYIYHLSDVDGVKFDLFGAGYTGENSDKVNYRGKFAPEELIVNLDGQFGLVWDGNSIDSCSGTTGNYLRYNNPHKLSLYIAAGVPVIVWKESALAKFVEDNDIGLSINRLSDLSDILKQIDKAKYEQMKTSINNIRISVISGKNLAAILNEI